MRDVGQEIPHSTGGAIDWSKQHCGVHQAGVDELLRLMPDLRPIIDDFPKDPAAFTWDVKVHMLMPRMYPCIPNWHRDFTPRIGGIQRPEMAADAEMYMWLSGPPLTEFRGGFIRPREWVRFSLADEHRGTPSGDFCWRGFIRAVDRSFLPPKSSEHLRRHCQVYLDASEYNW
jgi:hypothetical protein